LQRVYHMGLSQWQISTILQSNQRDGKLESKKIGYLHVLGVVWFREYDGTSACWLAEWKQFSTFYPLPLGWRN
jgi:hypothetical protein